MQCIYLPGAGIIMLLKDVKKIMKDKKNKNKLKSLCKTMFVFILIRLVVIE